MKNEQPTFTLEELCTLVEMNKRKVRFYIQKQLVDRPQGTGKGAHYSRLHLEQLLTIRKWKDAGLSLERIQELLAEENRESGKPVPPPRQKKTGSVEVWSHVHLAEGLELHIEPRRSGLTPEQVRLLSGEIVKRYEKIKSEEK